MRERKTITALCALFFTGRLLFYNVVLPAEERAMLELGRYKQRTCQGMTRRAFLQVGGSSVLGLSLADLLRRRAESGGTEPAGAVRSVLLLWLWGGPAQLDTWDPKPDAPLEYRGPFSAIPTRV